MRSPVQETLLASLAGVLRPIVKLLLKAGVGYVEFHSVVKWVFVQVASEEFGVRGRPTNISRVSAVTGISRKEVKRVREDISLGRWSPSMEGNPANVVVHYWHFDPKFSLSPGHPRPLPFEGPGGFTDLVIRYVGDIPPGAMRAALLAAGTVNEVDGLLTVQSKYFQSDSFDEDFIRRIMFSIRNLAATVVFNSEKRIAKGFGVTEELRFERCAWTEQLSVAALHDFREWSRKESALFIEHIDSWLGQHELSRDHWTDQPRTVGVGVYYFEEDRS